MPPNQRKTDDVILERINQVKEIVVEIKQENKCQWEKIQQNTNRLCVLETKLNGNKPSLPKDGFNYKSLTYIIPAALAFIGGLIAIIMRYIP